MYTETSFRKILLVVTLKMKLFSSSTGILRKFEKLQTIFRHIVQNTQRITT